METTPKKNLLKPGETILRTEFYAMELQIGELLGEGGQGEVYAAEQDGRKVAVKWYDAGTIKNDPGLRERLRWLSYQCEKPSKKFLWPIDVAASNALPGFGYVMPFREGHFHELNHAIYGDARPGLLERAKAGIEIAEAYQKLHAAGLCYRDINFGNVAIDVQTGETRICDCDNVGHNNERIRGGVAGTPTFMAPEIVTALAANSATAAYPNRDTDLWSLSVLLFRLFLVDHPLVGRREVSGDTDMQTLYGDRALFICDPRDVSNRPVPGWHDSVMRLWEIYPQILRDHFTQAFTAGIRNPDQRVRETDWRYIMARLRDTIHHCPHCSIENFHDGHAAQTCWHCGSTMPKPLCLKFKKHSVVMVNGAALYGQHVDAKNVSDPNKAVARVVRHPKHADLMGLENLDGVPWHAIFPDGKEITVDPNTRVGLHPGVRIDFGRVEGIVE